MQKKLGFRGEILATRLAGSEATAASGPRLMVSGVLSGDYTFPSSVYLHTELLYNNEGVLRNAALFRPEAQILGLLSPARWSIYLELSYNLDPLVRGSLFMLRNPADHSAVSVPSLTWSAMTNLDISLYGLLYSGGSGTEFGNVGSAFFLRGKLSI